MADQPVPDETTTKQDMWQDPQLDSMIYQDAARIEGEDPEVIEHMQGRRSTIAVQATLGNPGSRTVDLDLPGATMWAAAEAESTALGRNGVAEKLGPNAVSDWSVAIPEKTNEVLQTIRQEYADRRQQAARAITRYAMEDTPKERIMKAVGESPILPTTMGAFSPFALPQQTLFGLLTGEGWSAFSRFHPSYVIDEDIVDEDGDPVETTPWAASINAMWLDTVQADDETQEFAEEEMRSVTAQFGEDYIMAMDIPDAWAGKENMDQVYLDMLEGGFWGKIDMGLAAVGYAGVEVLLDPLLLAERVPTAIVSGLRRLSSTAFKARKAEELIAANGKTLESLVDALGAADNHLAEATARAAKATDRGEMTPRILKTVEVAKKYRAERADELMYRQRLHPDSFEFIHTTTTQRRNPSAIQTTRVLKDEIALETQVWKPGENKAWRVGLEADDAKGLTVDHHGVNDGVASFNMAYGDRLKNLKVGHAATGGTNDDVVRNIEALGESLGIRVIPFSSTGYKGGKPGKLFGAHIGETRTSYVNVLQDPHQMIEAFVHESWHHVAYSVLSAKEQGKLIDNLFNAGFPVGAFRDELNKGAYNLNHASRVVEEFTARSTSEMMTNPKFWDLLHKLNPEAFDELANSSMDMAMKSQRFVDNIGGRKPSMWIDGSERSWAGTKAPTSRADAWYDHNRLVANGIKKARHFTKSQMTQKVDDTVAEIDDLLLRMVDERDKIERVGTHSVKENNEEIAKLEKYRDRLEAGGEPELIDYPHIKDNILYTETVDEVFVKVQDARKAAALLDSKDIQPRPNLTDEGAYKLPGFEEMPDRVALGPDDAEVAAEGLGRLAHGADADDITMRLNQVPERSAMTRGNIVPSTIDNMIDMDSVGKYLQDFKDRATHRQFSLAQYDPEMALLDDAYKAAKQGHADGKVPYDKAWLPEPRKSTGELLEEGWNQTYQANHFDQISGALYPNTWAIKGPALLRAGWMWNREPMRVMNAVDPGAWRILRGANLNMENEMLRMQGKFHAAGKAFGAVTIDKPTTLKRLFMTNAKEKVSVNQDQSARLMQLMETSPTKHPRRYAELTEGLSGDQLQALSVIREELNHTAARFGLEGGDMFTENYMPHVFDAGLFAKGGNVPHYAGMSENGNLFMSHLLGRNGAEGYNPDAMAALEVYTRAAARKMHLEPGLQRIRARAEKVVSTPGRERDAFYLPYIDQTIAAYKGESSTAGEFVDKAASAMLESGGHAYTKGTLGRKLMSVNGLLYSSLLAGNRRYPIMAVATALATTGSQYHMFRTTKGLFKMATPEGQLVFKNMGGHKTWGRIFESSEAGGIKWLDKATHGLADVHIASPSIQSTENFIRGMTMWASIDEHMTKMGFQNIQQAAKAGYLEEIMFDSLLATESSNHFFGIGSKPPWMARGSKSVSAAGTQFLSFTPKQSEQLLHLAGKNPGHIGSFLMLSGWIARVGVEELGIDLDQYVGAQSIKFDSRNTISPGFQALLKASVYMNDMSALMSGYGDAETTTRSGDDLMKSIELLLPLLNRSREFAGSATATATGEKWSPGQGKVRDLDLKYMKIGDMEVPVMGQKGERGEALAIGVGARSEVERQHQEARREVRTQKNQVAIEQLELVERAQEAYRNNDWKKVNEQIDKLADAGYPVPDTANAAATQAYLDALSWPIQQLRTNPELRHLLLPIMEKYGTIRTEELDAENQ